MIEDLIRRYGPPLKRNRRGWEECKCPKCQDYRPRGAFKFDPDVVTYNCYNCSTATKYENGSPDMSKGFREIMRACTVPDDVVQDYLSSLFFAPKKLGAKDAGEKKFSHATPTVELPPGSVRLDPTSGDIWHVVAGEYLRSRAIDPACHDFYLSDHKDHVGYIIIPFYRNGRIIYWQKRNLNDASKMRWLNSTVAKDSVIFGYDLLYGHGPLFVCEGIFDALSLPGHVAANLGSALSEAKLDLYARSSRDLIFVIDRNDKLGNGYKLGKKVISLGYKITYLDGHKTDINRSVINYGRIFTVRKLIENTCEGFAAETALELIR